MNIRETLFSPIIQNNPIALVDVNDDCLSCGILVF